MTIVMSYCTAIYRVPVAVMIEDDDDDDDEVSLTTNIKYLQRHIEITISIYYYLILSF